ncbi:hypothetical protein OCU04_001020 [Sclerotinia nivalis]|uniref:Uncharacterized protein n=1 Tax=Sclerotinia nivalis TaxID=352851 RepID=A0A9X0AX99_9HELO|nr:hypothetical protein OCU04_001020 [Sclerotinia nivalis]
MLRYSLKTLDELDEIEEKKRLEKEHTEKGKGKGNEISSLLFDDSGLSDATFGLLENFDPSFFLSPSDPFWVDLDTVDEILQFI